MPEGYIVAKSPTYVNAVILRGFLVDGKTDAANKMFRDGLKIYPLAKAGNAPPMEFVVGSHKVFNTVDANTFAFYEELHAVLQKEPIDFIDPELRGQAASIGIVKGKPFAPDERMKKLLTEAVAVGNATARAIAFRNRDPRVFLYEKSQWKTGFIGGDYRWLDGDGVAGRDLDARTYFFYVATVNTPAMAAKMVGRGSQYAFINTDKDAKYLDGGKDYRLNIPANVPAKDFWSVVVYDPQTRSELQTGQPFPSKNNKRDELLGQRGRLGRPLLRPRGTARQGEELDANGRRQGLVRNAPPLWPARAVVRQDVASGGDRVGEVSGRSGPHRR